MVTSEDVEDRDGIAASETTRRPHGLRKVSYIVCVVSTEGCCEGTGWRLRGSCKTQGLQHLRNLHHGPSLRRCVETTQTLYDTLRRPRGRRVVSAAAPTFRTPLAFRVLYPP